MIQSKFLNIGAAVLALAGLTALFIGSAGDSYAAPSLVANGTFDDDANNWTAQTDTTLTWEATVDYNDDANSGSGTVTYTGTGAGDAEVISDCIVFTGDGTYDIEGQAQRNPQQWSGQGTPATSDDPTVEIIVTKFDDAACTTNPVPILSGSISLSNDNWFPIPTSGPGNVIVSGELSATVSLVVHGQAANDEAYFDQVFLSDGPIDTPTATNTPPATNTPGPTNTPAPTNTAAATNTAEPTQTEVPTDTPVPATNTPLPTNTPVPPTATNTVAVVIDDTDEPPAAELEDGVGAGGEQPEDAVGAGGEEPEGSEFPESGTGPGSYNQEGSAITDVIAMFSFALAIGMLATGFYMRRKYEAQEQVTR
jgi:hypothetical protein